MTATGTATPATADRLARAGGAAAAAPPDVTDEPRWFLANLARIRLSAEHGQGRIDLVEITGQRGDMPPLHVHHREDEIFVVLEGELSLHLPGSSRTLKAGQAAFAPMGVPHVYRVESETARWLGLSTPAGFSTFVTAASDAAGSEDMPPADRAPDLDRVGAAAAAAGIELLGPPGTMP
ncbi:MAG: cupin domain-containing protein [Solirubrobacterales bacterium]